MLCEELRKRVLLLDGAMGTMLTHSGRSDGLNLSQPSAVAHAHRLYLKAGADIVTTNTFTSICIDGGDANRMRALNAAGVRIARAEADRMTRLTPDRPRFVLGSVGPLAACEEDYAGQMRILAGEGVDAIIIETVIDKDKALLAAAAYDRVCTRCFPPLMISVSPSADGRLLSGESIEDFWKTMEPLHPLSIGLNCGSGVEYMTAPLQRLSASAACFVSCHPSAGLPDAQGKYRETPQTHAQHMQSWLERRMVNILGGCCGTTPAHTAALRAMIDRCAQTFPPRAVAPSCPHPSFGNPQAHTRG